MEARLLLLCFLGWRPACKKSNGGPQMPGRPSASLPRPSRCPVSGVPIPAEQAAAGAEVEAAIQSALSEADAQGVRGNDVTPFLLQRIQELTGGRSLKANIALVKNNAAVGSAVAAELARLRQGH